MRMATEVKPPEVHQHEVHRSDEDQQEEHQSEEHQHEGQRLPHTTTAHNEPLSERHEAGRAVVVVVIIRGAGHQPPGPGPTAPIAAHQVTMRRSPRPGHRTSGTGHHASGAGTGARLRARRHSARNHRVTPRPDPVGSNHAGPTRSVASLDAPPRPAALPD